uniref:Uncharacterized protein n=1 Tax=Mycena chlorophos TaxID=658473 RepID=A0ABQ0LEH8_MYCCL|nr:predicted protein [Mycena chlorophos]
MHHKRSSAERKLLTVASVSCKPQAADDTHDVERRRARRTSESSGQARADRNATRATHSRVRHEQHTRVPPGALRFPMQCRPPLASHHHGTSVVTEPQRNGTKDTSHWHSPWPTTTTTHRAGVQLPGCLHPNSIHQRQAKPVAKRLQVEGRLRLGRDRSVTPSVGLARLRYIPRTDRVVCPMVVGPRHIDDLDVSRQQYLEVVPRRVRARSSRSWSFLVLSRWRPSTRDAMRGHDAAGQGWSCDEGQGRAGVEGEPGSSVNTKKATAPVSIGSRHTLEPRAGNATVP